MPANSTPSAIEFKIWQSRLPRQARAFPAAIVTKIEPNREFYPAEDYHQDFMTRYPTHPYIVHHDLPKIEDLKRVFADAYRADPVLVAGTGRSH